MPPLKTCSLSTTTNKEMKGDVIHVSIDDVILVFKELTGQKPVSILTYLSFIILRGCIKGMA